MKREEGVKRDVKSGRWKERDGGRKEPPNVRRDDQGQSPLLNSLSCMSRKITKKLVVMQGQIPDSV